MKHPIDNIQWVPVSELSSNDYNPNHVMKSELNLLKHSLLTQGWIQPILVTPEKVIIDGFHRHLLAKMDPEVSKLTGGKVPVAILEITEEERKMLTVRINRAKGVHSSVKMHELVTDLYQSGVTMEEIQKGIGATRDEVELLLQENVFKKLKVDEHKYTQAWAVQEQKKGEEDGEE